MNSPKPADLMAMRLQAAANASERVDVLLKASCLSIESAYLELVSVHGWEPHEALMAMMQHLNQAHQNLARHAFPD
jgi:hypothetical protein